MGDRKLIVNADDFGQTFGINRGIVRAHEQGIVTSASLMVRWPAAADAADYACGHADLSLGLHVDLGEWIYRDGAWEPWYQVVDQDDPEAVGKEIRSQLDRFRKLVGRDPTHLDSHQHIHREHPARGVLVAIGHEIGVPVRQLAASVSYSGAFYGMTGKGEPYHQAITEESLIGIIANLPEGITELGCHPGEDDGTELVYQWERTQEAEVLCSPAVRESLIRHDVDLVNFQSVATRA